MAESSNRTNNDVVAELATKVAGKVEVLKISRDGLDASVAVLSQPLRVESLKKYLDEYRPTPERRKGTAKVIDLQSLIAHVLRFKDDNSVLFALPDPSSPTLTCVFNYNEPLEVSEYDGTKPEGARMVKRVGTPRFADHRVVYTFPLSEEWQAWRAGDGEEYDTDGFASFIEERLVDIGDAGGALEQAREFAQKLGVKYASPQRMLELSRGIGVHVNQQVKAHTKLGSGEAQISFVEEHADATGAPLDVPGAFLINVPVFKNGEPYQLAARLRYKVSNRTLTWWYDLYRADRTFEFAFNEACGKAAKDTGLEFFRGTPEQ